MTRVRGQGWYSGVHGIGPIFHVDQIAQLAKQWGDAGASALRRTGAKDVLAGRCDTHPVDCLGYGFVMLRSS